MAALRQRRSREKQKKGKQPLATILSRLYKLKAGAFRYSVFQSFHMKETLDEDFT
jgi:hypothetical protein